MPTQKLRFIRDWSKYKKHLEDNPIEVKSGWTSLVDRKTHFYSVWVNQKPTFEGYMDYLNNSIGLKSKQKHGKMSVNQSHSILDEPQEEEKV
jgi:hypothetical protein